MTRDWLLSAYSAGHAQRRQFADLSRSPLCSESMSRVDPKRRFLIVRLAVAKYFIVRGQEGRKLSRILRIGDSQ